VDADVRERELFARLEDAAAEFEERLRRIRPVQWTWSTPCSEWDVRALVNHVTRGNLNYELLVRGGTSAEFLRLREVDALGPNALEAYRRSVASVTAAFSEQGALDRVLDYPMGAVPGRRALTVRIIDTTIHTWDLARAIGADEVLDPPLVSWVDRHWGDVYAELVRAPFFDRPGGDERGAQSPQERMLRRSGRRPGGPDRGNPR
jgi:uncharacterized protein (TIGR03086 family)